tara:strand:- start:2672 stop:3694 length:1023 start_codon:yes stop_codon:yes gene_type:complete
MEKTKNKKAELTTKMLITIILVVLGLAIILFVYFQLDWTGRVDKEVCHQSVVYRATLPSIAGLKAYAPLKCKTDNMCITSKRLGKCEELENVKGVTRVVVDDKTEIEKTIAGEVIDCWNTMGQGKLLVFSEGVAGKYGIGQIGASCVICNRIAFDDEENLDGIDLEDIDVLNYMQTRAIPNEDMSYYRFLAGDGGKLSIEEESKELDEEGAGEIGEKDNEKYDQELAVMFMQVTAPTHPGSAANIAGTALKGYGGFFLLAPKTISKLTFKVAANPWTWVVAAIAIGYQQGNVAYNRAVAAGYCGDVTVGDDAKEGCSVVRVVDYNVDRIAEHCTVIESIA